MGGIVILDSLVQHQSLYINEPNTFTVLKGFQSQQERVDKAQMQI